MLSDLQFLFHGVFFHQRDGELESLFQAGR